MSLHIRDKISELLNKNKLSAASLEKKAGLKEGAVSNIIKQKSNNPSFSTISAIANSLNCSLYDFNEKEEVNSELDEFLYNNIQWNYVLFMDTLENVELFLKKYNLKLDFKKTVSILKEVYVYSLERDRNASKADLSFTEWFIKNIFKKIKI